MLEASPQQADSSMNLAVARFPSPSPQQCHRRRRHVSNQQPLKGSASRFENVLNEVENPQHEADSKVYGPL